MNANNSNNRRGIDQVTPEIVIQVFGDKGKSQVIALTPKGEEPHFQPGQEDEFEVRSTINREEFVVTHFMLFVEAKGN